MNTRDSWHERGIPKTGTAVYDAHDVRFVGRLDAVLHDADLGRCGRVTWENGWRSDVPLRRMRRA